MNTPWKQQHEQQQLVQARRGGARVLAGHASVGDGGRVWEFHVVRYPLLYLYLYCIVALALALALD